MDSARKASFGCISAPSFQADDPAVHSSLIGKEVSAFLKDGMTPAVLTDISETTTVRAIKNENVQTNGDGNVLLAEVKGLPAPEPTTVPELPQTGDSARPLLWLIICMASGLSVMLLWRRSRE